MIFIPCVEQPLLRVRQAALVLKQRPLVGWQQLVDEAATVVVVAAAAVLAGVVVGIPIVAVVAASADVASAAALSPIKKQRTCFLLPVGFRTFGKFGKLSKVQFSWEQHF